MRVGIGRTRPVVARWGMASGELKFGSARVLRLGGGLVSAHLLADDAGLTLIDTGLWGVPGQVRRAVARLGRRREELREVVLTHGHLDHTGGAAEIQAWSGARVWVHAADRDHVEQAVEYRGLARGCGWLETAGRVVGRAQGRTYCPPVIGAELRDGDLLPVWGGLRVRHLPGHTPGHCALVAERREACGLVFSADSFASYGWSVHRPPWFLTRDRVEAERSLRALAELRPEAVLPSHYDRMDPALHARRLAKLVGGGA